MNKIIQILRKTDQYLQFTFAVSIAILLYESKKMMPQKIFLLRTTQIIAGTKIYLKLALSHRHGILFQKIV